ncbi:hypothetical protein GTO91_15875 [Heliobacterium undosum]|uniref:Uncharacterized protein n=1 Tax=Heliomicrobium undosum TaxID=121734 RepID=A0A845L658_9FIRM|nr:DUF6075 family protein [Heliomicrobium undosum]MZP31186.1 hypothetical protein [Heliomicrobium undosum]
MDDTILIPRAAQEMLARDSTNRGDRERLALFYILGSVSKLKRMQTRIYDFKERQIIPEVLSQADFSHGERCMLKLAFHLYNGWECPSVRDLFSTFDEDFRTIALKAIAIRFRWSELVFEPEDGA